MADGLAQALQEVVPFAMVLVSIDVGSTQFTASRGVELEGGVSLTADFDQRLFPGALDEVVASLPAPFERCRIQLGDMGDVPLPLANAEFASPSDDRALVDGARDCSQRWPIAGRSS